MTPVVTLEGPRSARCAGGDSGEIPIFVHAHTVGSFIGTCNGVSSEGVLECLSANP